MGFVNLLARTPYFNIEVIINLVCRGSILYYIDIMHLVVIFHLLVLLKSKVFQNTKHMLSLSSNELENIHWTDEAIFRLDGVVNRHNCIVWGSERPRPVSQGLHANQVCVWMGFSKELKLIPFFFDGTVTGESHHNMLTTQVILQLRSPGKLTDTIFQQDGLHLIFLGK